MKQVKVISKTLDENAEFKFGDVLIVTKGYSNLPNTISITTIETIPNCFEWIDEQIELI